MLKALSYYFNFEPFAMYLKNDISKFITRLQNGLSKKLLTYSGLSSESESESDIDSSSDKTDSTLLKPEIKYEDKYLEDIKKMSLNYKFTWADLTLIDDKFNELFNTYKTNLDSEKASLNLQIVEKGMKYLEIEDEDEDYSFNYENSSDDFFEIDLKEKGKKKLRQKLICYVL
jgi:hypothetical protein